MNNIRLESEINNVLINSVEEEFPDIHCILHNPEEDSRIPYLMSVDVVRDFAEALTDTIFIEALVPIGDYIEKYYRFRNKLEITLCIKRNLKQKCTRYKAIILNVDKNVTSSKLQSLNIDDLNKTNLIELKIQLVPIELILIKSLKHEGIYHNITALEAVEQSMIYELSKAKLYGSYFNININSYKTDYDKKEETIIIPRGTKLGKIPSYIQEKYGYYNYNANCYFKLDNDINKNLYLWIYPIADLSRVKNENNIGFIYNTARTGYSAGEASYYKKNGQLKLISDISDIGGDNYNDLFDKGKGLEFQSVTSNIKSFNYNVKNNVDNYETYLELFTVKDNDGTDFTTNIGLTDNPASITTLLNMKRLSYIQTVVYNFSGLWGEDPLEELIYPGMPFYYVYNTEDHGISRAVTLPGTLVKQHITFDLNKKSMASAFMLGVEKPLIALYENKGT